MLPGPAPQPVIPAKAGTHDEVGLGRSGLD